MNRQQNGAQVVKHPAVGDPYSRVGRLQTKWFNRRDFLLGFLAVFSLCSLLLNGVFLFHLSHPSFWRDFKLSWLQPPPVRATDHIRGDSNASVTIVEYADFQCPYCQQMHASLQTSVQEGRIRWIYRHFPLTSIHPQAFKEAEAAECAGAQGKFWEYADALFAAQARLGSSRALDRELASLAEGINADPAALKECLDSAQFNQIVKNQMREAEALQISGTPTIFIDSERHEGSVSYNDLKGLLANHPT
jgi:predicted DsbA family dithiol-disulfide isomerase